MQYIFKNHNTHCCETLFPQEKQSCAPVLATEETVKGYGKNWHSILNANCLLRVGTSFQGLWEWNSTHLLLLQQSSNAMSTHTGLKSEFVTVSLTSYCLISATFKSHVTLIKCMITGKCTFKSSPLTLPCSSFPTLTCVVWDCHT